LYYSIRHQTKFRYAQPVAETVMEVRVQPRTEWTQHCLSFDIQVWPRARVMNYRDHLGNIVHNFNVPARTDTLSIVATSMVEVKPFMDWPEVVPAGAWNELDMMNKTGEYHEMLLPSEFARSSPQLQELAAQLDVRRRDDPMTLLRQVNHGIFERFEYTPKSTLVDSPIEVALSSRQGVCQDFAHIMIALMRPLGIPCRYVSGYVVPTDFAPERMAAGLATHAWVEALLPSWGWVGFDPTNNKLVAARHIRCAVGRDYADVPPTKGVYRGGTRGELSVNVAVIPSEEPSSPGQEFAFPVIEEWVPPPPAEEKRMPTLDQIQQQQQQQQ
jgi:transglutaminase-like putative cysteine protease